jgi:2-phospho-L-lactate guanylyltransferase
MWAVLPAKNFEDAKTRLADVLDADERRGLFRTMYEDVLSSLCSVSMLQGVLVVTRDETAAALARKHGAEVLTEAENRGQTAAVEAAANWLAGQGVDGMLAVPGDVPLVPPGEIEAVLTAHETSRGMTIVPARDERGSNCIACSPPDLISFHFGNDSFQPHLRAAEAAGVTPKVLRLSGIGLDIDRPDDLAALVAEAGESRAQIWLRENGVADRIAVTA